MEGLGGWRVSGSFGFAQDDKRFGWVEMGGGGRARRAIPTHRKERDEWAPNSHKSIHQMGFGNAKSTFNAIRITNSNLNMIL